MSALIFDGENWINEKTGEITPAPTFPVRVEVKEDQDHACSSEVPSKSWIHFNSEYKTWMLSDSDGWDYQPIVYCPYCGVKL